jgi:CBS domain-containing protein
MARSSASVRDVMSPGIIVVAGDTTVAACAAIMYERRTHAVLVVDDRSREPLGWVFHRDVLRHLRSDPLTTVAADVVSAEPAYIDPEATVDEAAERMVQENITHLLVGKSPDRIPEGVISSWDLVAHYARPRGRL